MINLIILALIIAVLIICANGVVSVIINELVIPGWHWFRCRIKHKWLYASETPPIAGDERVCMNCERREVYFPYDRNTKSGWFPLTAHNKWYFK